MVGTHRHRDHGLPAEQHWDVETGIQTYEGYFQDGTAHRRDEPAITLRHRVTGEVIGETWAEGGCLHREGGLPALWDQDPKTGVMVTEEYWAGGVRHRAGGLPAEIHRDEETGKIIAQTYYFEGKPMSPCAARPLRGLEP